MKKIIILFLIILFFAFLKASQVSGSCFIEWQKDSCSNYCYPPVSGFFQTLETTRTQQATFETFDYLTSPIYMDDIEALMDPADYATWNGSCYNFSYSYKLYNEWCIPYEFFSIYISFCSDGTYSIDSYEACISAYEDYTYGSWDVVCDVDPDNDGVPDNFDNCPVTENPDQADADNDGTGDACDNCTIDPGNDIDRDGVCGNLDNCPDIYNPAQADSDNDTVGDACDNCPDDYNPNQFDSDNDGVADACDNCPDDYNPNQFDSDNDGVADACDNCPDDYNPNQMDSDKDTFGDSCDNCINDYNPVQGDYDGDGTGNICDNYPCYIHVIVSMESKPMELTDTECDGIPNVACWIYCRPQYKEGDNCPDDYNPDQEDTDGDGIGDVCDPVLIELSSFTAAPANGKVTLDWSTASEIDNAGFNIYRSGDGGKYAQINASLIPAQGSPTEGASYEFVDGDVKNRKTYWYKLEDVDLNGVTTMHGPVSGTPRLIYGIIK